MTNELRMYFKFSFLISLFLIAEQSMCAEEFNPASDCFKKTETTNDASNPSYACSSFKEEYSIDEFGISESFYVLKCKEESKKNNFFSKSFWVSCSSNEYQKSKVFTSKSDAKKELEKLYYERKMAIAMLNMNLGLSMLYSYGYPKHYSLFYESPYIDHDCKNQPKYSDGVSVYPGCPSPYKTAYKEESMLKVEDSEIDKAVSSSSEDPTIEGSAVQIDAEIIRP